MIVAIVLVVLWGVFMYWYQGRVEKDLFWAYVAGLVVIFCGYIIWGL